MAGKRTDSALEPEELNERLQTFLQRRRLEAATQRRQRNSLPIIVCLGLACIVLAASTVVLALRLAATRPATAVAPAPSQAVPGGEESQPREAAEPAGELTAEEVLALFVKALREREPAATPSPEGAAGTPPAVAPAPETPAASGMETQPREAPAAEREAVGRQPAATATAPRETDSRWRTAAWMLQRYGKREAEEHARAAAAFYDPQHPTAEFWRAVLAYIREAPGE